MNTAPRGRGKSRRRQTQSTTDGVIESLFRRGSAEKVLSFFARSAHPLGCRPTARTFSLLVTAAKLCGSINNGEALHSHALKLGFLPKLVVSNSLVHMYASCDGLDFARQLFDEMPRRDTVSYNSMIDGYVQSDELDKAESLFYMMPERNVVSWATLFNGYVKGKKFNQGFYLFRQMQQESFELSDSIIVSLLLFYMHLKMGLYGKSVHGLLLRRWSGMPVHVCSALIDFYCKCGYLYEAVKLFDLSEVKDLISWNTLISGLARQGRGSDAIVVFSEMLKHGVMPDDITFTGVLVACAHSGFVKKGLYYFDMMTSEFGIEPRFSHYWCLVDLFVRASRPSDALKVIQDMPLDSESAIWSAVVWLAKVHGDIKVGEYLGRRLIDLEPYNSRRYVPLVNLYAAASKWDKFKELQEEMKARGLNKLPDCTFIDLNVLAHKFDLGDKRQPEIEEMYEALEEIAKLLELQSLGCSVNVSTDAMQVPKE